MFQYRIWSNFNGTVSLGGLNRPFVLSEIQIKILLITYKGHADRQPIYRQELSKRLFQPIAPTSGSQRATLSRSVKRLVRQGLIKNENADGILLPTSRGIELGEWLSANKALVKAGLLKRLER